MRTRHVGSVIALITAMFLLAVPVFAGNIDATFKYAWSENFGWINFGTTQGDVTLTATEMTGYAWGENIGWISLNCSNTGTCGGTNYGVANDGSGNLSGFAWSENVGWINFSPTFGGVTVDTVTGIFTGLAWGENTGWVVFNCDVTLSCGGTDYYVKTGFTVTPTPAPPRVGVYITPSPQMSPTPSGSPTVPQRTPLFTSQPPPQPTGTPAVKPPTTPPPGVQPPGPPPGIPRPPGFPSPSVLVPLSIRILAPAVTVFSVIITLIAFGQIAEILRMMGYLAQSFWGVIGLKKKARVWGTIYDSVTKRPIPFAKVELLDAGNRLLETRLADRDGRYGFLTSPASLQLSAIEIQLRVTKDGYVFPTQIVSEGTADYFVYDRVYRGGVRTFRIDDLVRFDIPMDPVAGAQRAFSLWMTIRGVSSQLMDLSFWAGIVILPINIALNPSWASYALLALFVAVNGLRLVSGISRPFGIAVDSTTGRPIPFALIELRRNEERVAWAVSDEHGRYILQSPEGSFALITHTPAQVQPSRTNTVTITTKGWVTDRIVV